MKKLLAMFLVLLITISVTLGCAELELVACDNFGGMKMIDIPPTHHFNDFIQKYEELGEILLGLSFGKTLYICASGEDGEYHLDDSGLLVSEAKALIMEEGETNKFLDKIDLPYDLLDWFFRELCDCTRNKSIICYPEEEDMYRHISFSMKYEKEYVYWFCAMYFSSVDEAVKYSEEYGGIWFKRWVVKLYRLT